MYASVGFLLDGDSRSMEIAAHVGQQRVHVDIGDLSILLTPEQAARLRDALTAALTPNGDKL